MKLRIAPPLLTLILAAFATPTAFALAEAPNGSGGSDSLGAALPESDANGVYHLDISTQEGMEENAYLLGKQSAKYTLKNDVSISYTNSNPLPNSNITFTSADNAYKLSFDSCTSSPFRLDTESVTFENLKGLKFSGASTAIIKDHTPRATVLSVRNVTDSTDNTPDVEITNCTGGPNFYTNQVDMSQNGDIQIHHNTPGNYLIYSYGDINLADNGNISIDNNTTDYQKFIDTLGALTIQGNKNISLSDNIMGTTLIYAFEGVQINGNGDILIDGNKGSRTRLIDAGNIEVKNNGNITVSDNEAMHIFYNHNSQAAIDISGNKNVRFENNTNANDGEGAIYSYGAVVMNDNDEVVFDKQAVYLRGDHDSACISANSLEMKGNDKVSFTGNKGDGSYGSTIIDTNLDATISGSKLVEIIGNDGFNSDGNLNNLMVAGESLNLSSNDTLKIENNAGMIAGKKVNITNNGSVTFSGNRQNSTFSEHIEASDGDLNIAGNNQVVFEKNYVRNSDADFRVGTYLEAWAGSANLSAKEGGSIEFNDRAYILSTKDINLNGDYVDAEGKTQKATGDIVFTGKHAESNINDVLASHNLERKASNDEINYARTSDLRCTNATLQGGTLRVEDKAVVNININGGSGLSVTDGSHATVKIDNAELNMGDSYSKYAINIGNTGTLTMANEAKLMASTLDIATGATLAAVGSSGVSALSSSMYNTAVAGNIVANLTLEAGSTLVADGASFTMGDNCVLTFVAATGKELINLELSFGVAYTADDQVLLFSGVDSVQFMVDGEALTDTSVQASKFFTGDWVNENTMLNYNSATQAVYVQNVNHVIPEPATATLSLLALAGLAARRRRK